MPKTKQTNMKFAKDELGKDILLQENSRQVRMEWEKPYLEACIEALKPEGKVLEIGYGLGYSAAQIQKHKPKNHIIIEQNPEIAAQAKKWASKMPANTITIITGQWQDEIENLGKFNAIFFDDYVPFGEGEVNQLKMDSETCLKIAEQSKKLRDDLESKLNQFSGVKFSDQDLHSFASQIVKRPGITVDQVLRFIDRLVEMKNITTKQREAFTKEFKSQVAKQGLSPEDDFQSTVRRIYPIDYFAKFVSLCLDKHLEKGGRLSAYNGCPESHKDNPTFRDLILSRKDVRYTEKDINVKVPKNCRYYQGDKALIFVVEKK